MRSRLALLSTAAAFAVALAGPAYAVEESPTKTPGTAVEGQASDQNPGALEAPEKNPTMSNPQGEGPSPDQSAANVPGTSAEGDPATENPGSLSAPESNEAAQSPSDSGPSDSSAANVPGSEAEGDAKTENQGALSSPEKDADSMTSGSVESETKTY